MNLGFNAYSKNVFSYEKNTEIIDNSLAINECFDGLINASKSSITLQRYKGLGEMNPSQLEETTMNPKSRNLIKVLPLEEGNTVVSDLMGSDVEPRKQFIKEEYNNVLNLDI